jgi:hypothetical protein
VFPEQSSERVAAREQSRKEVRHMPEDMSLDDMVNFFADAGVKVWASKRKQP